MSSGQSDSAPDSPQTSSTQTVTLVCSHSDRGVCAALVISVFCKIVSCSAAELSDHQTLLPASGLHKSVYFTAQVPAGVFSHMK